MKIASKTGSILTLLIFLMIAGGVFIYWKSTSEERMKIEKRGFLTYEEYQRRQEREKIIQDTKVKIQNFFEKIKGRT